MQIALDRGSRGAGPRRGSAALAMITLVLSLAATADESMGTVGRDAPDAVDYSMFFLADVRDSRECRVRVEDREDQQIKQRERKEAMQERRKPKNFSLEKVVEGK